MKEKSIYLQLATVTALSLFLIFWLAFVNHSSGQSTSPMGPVITPGSNLDATVEVIQTQVINGGSIQILPSGGQSPYLYRVEGPKGTLYLDHHQNVVHDLPYGHYSIRVRDAMGYEVFRSIDVLPTLEDAEDPSDY